MSSKLTIPVNENDHHLNYLHAPVILLEYGDYECPYSAVAAPKLNRLVKEYSSELCFAYRHFPLKNIHDYAEVAALAAEAAGQQNEFWRYHELLFDNQEHLSQKTFERLAKSLGLDLIKFKEDLGRYDLLEKVRSDHQEGNSSGVQSTPTLFINGFIYDGPTNYWSLKEAIEIELNGSLNTTL